VSQPRCGSVSRTDLFISLKLPPAGRPYRFEGPECHRAAACPAFEYLGTLHNETSWQNHSIRGFVSGKAPNKMALSVES
jgi:hypothetical protein